MHFDSMVSRIFVSECRKFGEISECLALDQNINPLNLIKLHNCFMSELQDRILSAFNIYHICHI